MTHKFSVGDVVRVVKRVEKEDGWSNMWARRMDDAIGQQFTIDRIDARGIEFYAPYGSLRFDVYDYWYPAGCLELVSQAASEET